MMEMRRALTIDYYDNDNGANDDNGNDKGNDFDNTNGDKHS